MRLGSVAVGLVVAAAVVLVAATGCFNVDVPAGVAISCGSNGDCPGKTTCNLNVKQCIPAGAETVAPALAALTATPPRGRAGDSFVLDLTASEKLHAPPPGTIHGGALTLSGDAATSGDHFQYSYVANGTEVEGAQTAAFDLVDLVGNTASVTAPAMVLDFTPPTVESRVLSPDAAAAPPDATLTFTVVAEAGALIENAALVDDNGASLGALSDATVSSVQIGGVDKSEIVVVADLGTLALADGAAVAVDVTLSDDVGNSTPAGTVRSHVVTVDGSPPQQVSVTIVEAPVTAGRDVTVIVGADGADEMCIVENAAGDATPACDTFVPYAVQSALTLGDVFGRHTVTVVARDDAGNVAAPVSADIDYIPQGGFGVTVSLPLGFVAATRAASFTVGIQGPIGATIASARVVDASAGAVLLQALDVSGVTAAADGSASLPVTLAVPDSADGENIAVEVIMLLDGQTSVPGLSRSASFVYDISAPAVPVTSQIVVTSVSPDPFDPALVDDVNNTVEVTGLAGALPGASTLQIFGGVDTSGAALATAPVASNGSFAEIDLAPRADNAWTIVAIDEAGVVSNPSALTLVTTTFTIARVAQRRDPNNDGDTNVLAVDLQAASSEPLTGTIRARLLAPGNRTLWDASDPGLDTLCSVSTQPTGEQTVGCFVPVYDGYAPGRDGALLRVDADSAVHAPGSTATSAVAISIDVEPPIIEPGLVVITQSPHGTADRLTIAAGAFSDDIARPDELNVVVSAGFGARLLAYGPVQSDGGFPSVDLGDDQTDGVLIAVFDSAGNAARITRSNDRVGPGLASFTSAPASVAPGGSVTLTFDLVDDHVVNSATVALGNHAPIAATLLGRAGRTSSFRAVASSAGLAVGTVPVTVVATDALGNAQSTRASVIVDDVAPSTSILVPPIGIWEGLPFAQGTASDALGSLARVEIAVDDEATGSFADAVNGTFSSATPVFFTAVGTARWSIVLDALPFVDGADYRAVAHAVDAAGNVGGDDEHVFTYRTPSPTVPIDNASVSVIADGLIEATWTPFNEFMQTFIAAPGEGFQIAGFPDPSLGHALIPSSSARLGRGTSVVGLVRKTDGALQTFTVDVPRFRHPGALVDGIVRRVLALPNGSYLALSDDAGAFGEVLSRSDDGRTWRPIADRIFDVQTAGSHVVATNDTEVLVSDDAALSFTSFPAATPEPLFELALTNGRAWGKGSSGIERSDDGGRTWVVDARFGSNVNQIAGAGDVFVAFLDNEAAVRSVDAANPQAISPPLGWNGDPAGLSVSGSIWVASDENSIRVSRDDAATWTQAASSSGPVHTDGSTVVIGANFGDLFTSTNGGFFTPTRRGAGVLAIGTVGTDWYAIGRSLLHSSDGVTWSDAGSDVVSYADGGSGFSLLSAQIAGSDAGALVAARPTFIAQGIEQPAYFGTIAPGDGMVSQLRSLPVDHADLAPVNGGTLANIAPAAAGATFAFLDDNALDAGWRNIIGLEPIYCRGQTHTAERSVSICDTQANTQIIVAVDDVAQTVTSSHPPIAVDRVTNIALAARDDGALFLVTEDDTGAVAAWHSSDDAVTWQATPGALPVTAAPNPVLCAADETRVAVAAVHSTSADVFTSDDDGATWTSAAVPSGVGMLQVVRGRVFVTNGVDLLVSDDGTAFTVAASNVQVSTIIDDGTTLYALRNAFDPILTSDDGGTTFNVLAGAVGSTIAVAGTHVITNTHVSLDGTTFSSTADATGDRATSLPDGTLILTGPSGAAVLDP